jgi:RHS repeat-associated protein
MNRWLVALILVVFCSGGAVVAESATGARLYRITLAAQEGADPGAVAKGIAAIYGARIESPVAADGTVEMTVEMAVADLLGRDSRITRMESPAAPVPPAAAFASEAGQPRFSADATTDWSTGAYAYDAAGNITQIGVDRYYYDLYSRLKYGSAGGVGQQFTYDRYGNLTSVMTGSNAAIPLTVTATNNRLTHYNGTAITYDAAGRVEQVGAGTKYTHDAAGMMIASGPPAAPTQVYVYTASDERIASVLVNGSGEVSSTWTFRDPAGKVLRRFDKRFESGQWKWVWQQDYIYNGSQMLAAEIEGLPRTLHYFADHLGTPRLTTGNGGVRVAENVYHPFGGSAGATGRQDAKKFTGHERDSTGLDYMHARYYDWAWGRFLSADPKGRYRPATAPQQWNRYAYGLNNPLKFVDPDGRENTIFIIGSSSKPRQIGPMEQWLAPKVRGTPYEGRIETIGPQASKGQLLSTLRRADSTDLVIVAGHSGRSPDAATGGNFITNFGGKTQTVTGAEMAKWANDGSAPRAVIVAACCSNQIAGTISSTAGSDTLGTSVRTVNGENQAGAVDAAATLANGGTIDEAAAAANQHMQTNAGCGRNPGCDVNAPVRYEPNPRP